MAGEPSHFELGVPDARRAKAFYGELLGWSFTTTKGENAWIETPGVRGGLHDEDEAANIVVYFAVADIEAAVKRVRDLGGTADEPGPAETGGRFASCRDDQGVAFGLHQPNWAEMKHATDYLTFETPNRRDYVNITGEVEAFVARSGIRHGLCLVNPMHITAAVYVNDAESGLIQDFDDWLERLAPHEPTDQYRHNNGEDNADAHLKRQLMAHQVVLPITDGKLDLGPWEQVFYAEFDGRRRKRVVLKAIGD